MSITYTETKHTEVFDHYKYDNDVLFYFPFNAEEDYEDKTGNCTYYQALNRTTTTRYTLGDKNFVSRFKFLGGEWCVHTNLSDNNTTLHQYISMNALQFLYENLSWTLHIRFCYNGNGKYILYFGSYGASLKPYIELYYSSPNTGFMFKMHEYYENTSGALKSHLISKTKLFGGRDNNALKEVWESATITKESSKYEDPNCVYKVYINNNLIYTHDTWTYTASGKTYDTYDICSRPFDDPWFKIGDSVNGSNPTMTTSMGFNHLMMLKGVHPEIIEYSKNALIPQAVYKIVTTINSEESTLSPGTIRDCEYTDDKYIDTNRIVDDSSNRRYRCYEYR